MTEQLVTAQAETPDIPTGLRATLESAGGSLRSLTVLAPQNDPFRVDTDANHRDAAWLRDMLTELRLTGPRHLRGLHYAFIGHPKPNGLPYTNTDTDWQWLATPAKAARWLGYVPFNRIVDQRNDEPIITLWTPPSHPPRCGIETPKPTFELPAVEASRTYAYVDGFETIQPYHLVLVGEKSSLRPTLTRIADRYNADLFLPTGEISDTQVHTMAAAAVRDGRPMIVFYFADCDPAGWQMPISLARKLQALKAMMYPNLEFEVHRVALTPDQVREYGLPSTPLKDTERRADRWQAAMGVAQTEIDALAALQPRLLEDIADDAVSKFYDDKLDLKVQRARFRWREEAQAVIDAAEDTNLEQLRREATAKLAEKQAEIEEILASVRIEPADLADKLPPLPDLPAAELEPDPGVAPLCTSRWSFADQCNALIAAKQYQTGGVVQ
jgi:hypothetical protein